MTPTEIDVLREQHNRDITHLDESIVRLELRIESLRNEVQTAINHLHNRPPIWATVVMSIMTAAIGYLVSLI